MRGEHGQARDACTKLFSPPQLSNEETEVMIKEWVARLLSPPQLSKEETEAMKKEWVARLLALHDLAVDKNDSDSQFELGRSHETGSGVKLDLVEGLSGTKRRLTSG